MKKITTIALISLGAAMFTNANATFIGPLNFTAKLSFANKFGDTDISGNTKHTKFNTQKVNLVYAFEFDYAMLSNLIAYAGTSFVHYKAVRIDNDSKNEREFKYNLAGLATYTGLRLPLNPQTGGNIYATGALGLKVNTFTATGNGRIPEIKTKPQLYSQFGLGVSLGPVNIEALVLPNNKPEFKLTDRVYKLQTSSFMLSASYTF